MKICLENLTRVDYLPLGSRGRRQETGDRRQETGVRKKGSLA
ncbi:MULTISPECIES: hypothetical protein [unclassified Okeania]|nr:MULTISPECIES: hypothetical protein [unclassified Okeania]